MRLRKKTNKQQNRGKTHYKNTGKIQLINLKENRIKTNDYFAKMGYMKYEDYPEDGLTLEDIEKQYNEFIEVVKITMEQLKNSHETIPTITFQKRRDEINNTFKRINNAYEHINNEQVLSLRNAIYEISRRSGNHRLNYPREEIKSTRRKIVDLHVFSKENSPTIIDTKYLKVNRIANLSMDMTDGRNASVDGSLSKFSIYLPSINGKTGKPYTSYISGEEKKSSHSFTCYISGLDEEKLRTDLTYQKTILQEMERSIIEKEYPYLGKIEEQRDGSYMIKKVEVQKQACLMADGILLEQKRRQIVKGREEK